MSGEGKFAGGFLVGAIFGSILGGVLAIAWEKNLPEGEDISLLKFKREKQGNNPRRNLEDQIAQIRSSMDDMNEQLGAVIEQSAQAAKSQAEQ